MPESFAIWFRRNLPGVRYFSASEFLTKGASHAKNGLNTDPPRELWSNVMPLVRILDDLRTRLGKPITLHSVYRSKAYNTAVGGAPSSQHMLFKAADFSVEGLGKPADWAATLRAMRVPGRPITVGIYDTFVHVDVRPVEKDFDYRKGKKTAGKVLGTAPMPSPFMSQPEPEDALAPSPEPKTGLWAWFLSLFKGSGR